MRVTFVGIAVLLAFAGSARSTMRPAPPPAFVVALVRHSASALGDPHPTSARYVASRRNAAVEVSSGDSVNSNQPVYLVVLTGHFVARAGPRPFGASAPRGTVATYVIDAATGQDIDFGIGPKAIDPARLGPVGNLLPYLKGEKTPVCGAPDLRGTAGFQGATGSQLGGLSLINKSSITCTLPAHASVALTWRGKQLAIRDESFPRGWLTGMNSRWSKTLHVLKPGRRTEVLLQWLNWCGRNPATNTLFYPVIHLSLPGQPVPSLTRVREGVTPPFCNAPQSILRVSPFLPPP